MTLLLLLSGLGLLAIPACARPLARRLPPSEWAKAAAGLLAAGAVVVEASLALQAAPVVLRAVGLEGVAELCEHTLSPVAPGGVPLGIAAAVATIVVVLLAGRSLLAARRAAGAGVCAVGAAAGGGGGDARRDPRARDGPAHAGGTVPTALTTPARGRAVLAGQQVRPHTAVLLRRSVGSASFIAAADTPPSPMDRRGSSSWCCRPDRRSRSSAS